MMDEDVIAYYFEIASSYDNSTKTYGGWVVKLTFTKPIVPEEAIRNLKELVEKKRS